MKDENLSSAIAEAVEVLGSVCDAGTAPKRCLVECVEWFPIDTASVGARVLMRVPEAREVAALHGIDPARVAREAGLSDARDADAYLVKVHGVSVKPTLAEWLADVVDTASQGFLTDRPFDSGDGGVFKLYLTFLNKEPAIDETDGESRLIVFKVDVIVDDIPAGAYDAAEAACDERFPGWRTFAAVDFEPGLDEKGAYLAGSLAIGGRLWNVWVTEMDGAIDAGFVIGQKASSATFAKKQGIRSFAQCLNWITTVIEGVEAGAYDERIAKVEKGGSR